MSHIPAPPPSCPSGDGPENNYGIKGSPMGGWLVIFIAMYVISAAQGLLGLYPAFMAAFQMPKFAGAFLGILSIIGLWNVFIFYCMIQVILQKPKAVRLTKAMLLTGPLIAAITPLLGVIAVTSTVPDAQLDLELVTKAYTAEVAGQISGMVLLSAIWYRYFCGGRRRWRS